MGERDSKSKSFKRGSGDDKPAAPAKESAGLSGMARRFAAVDEKPEPPKAAAKATKPK